VVDGELVWSKGYGVGDVEARAPVDVDTVFRMGSMTKTLTATAIMQLRDEGKLRLDDLAWKYVPELADVVYLFRDTARMTVWNPHAFLGLTGVGPVQLHRPGSRDHWG
jgi:CubicO group peptidase (beta-lactamase class C family)